MARYILVAGVDFGTSFTKVVLRDTNAPGQSAEAVTFPRSPNGLLPSVVGHERGLLFPSDSVRRGTEIPYLKMHAAYVASGGALDASPIRCSLALSRLQEEGPSDIVVRDLLAFHFAHVIAATEIFIKSRSRWRDFDFAPGNVEDFLIFQLAVPSGFLTDDNAVEHLFRQAFIAGYELRTHIDGLSASIPAASWSEQVARVLTNPSSDLAKRFQWQCLLYPEVAAAVQTVFRSPNARDGLYITMDVGAGTVDLNAFLRFTGNQKGLGGSRRIDYYAAIVCPLGVRNLSDPHKVIPRRTEAETMAELRETLGDLYRRAINFQPNFGGAGNHTWDDATLLIFGGGANYPAYPEHFRQGIQHAGITGARVRNLPAAQDLDRPVSVEFGRFAVAYGLSFFRPNLDSVRLPHELATFRELYPAFPEEARPEFGFNWED